MDARTLLAIAGVVVVTTVDALLVQRILSAFRSTGRAPHLFICAGIICSGITTACSAGLFAAAREPAHFGAATWSVLRGGTMLGAAVSYGLVGLFTASAFHRRSPAAWLTAAAIACGLAAIAVAAIVSEPVTVDTPATIRYSLRVPFVALGVGAAAWAAGEARRLHVRLARAERDGKRVDAVALGRMRIFGRGSAAIALSQLALFGYPPGGDWDTATGRVCAAALLLGALLFVLGCYATWATPQWLRRRWEDG